MENTNFHEYDEEFSNLISPLLESGILKVIDNITSEKYGQIILKNYPFKLSRVHFLDTNLIVSKSDFHKITESDWVDLLNKKLTYVALNEKILDLEFVLIGDNEIENSYSFILKDFLGFFWNFFSIPQHTYFISKSGNYLFTYTFEDDLYFIHK